MQIEADYRACGQSLSSTEISKETHYMSAVPGAVGQREGGIVTISSGACVVLDVFLDPITVVDYGFERILASI